MPLRRIPRAAAATTAAVLTGACGAAAAQTSPTGPPPQVVSTRLPAASVSPPSPPPTPVPLAVTARPFHEPGDHAHRNYCGVGATEVLLSAWMPVTPGLEDVARRSHLDPNSGETGADATAAVNSYLDPIVVPAVGHPWYRADHVVALAGVEDRLRADLGSVEALHAFGHTVPVMVQVMTHTLPGWSGWQATHMITVVAADLSHDDPTRDTVTYAETPSPLAGYRGPDFQVITVAALWQAMQSFLARDPADPVNVVW